MKEGKTEDLQLTELSTSGRNYVARIERGGWCVFTGVLVCAVLGLFGKGLISERIAGSKNSGLWIEYVRFDRYQSPTEFRIHVGAGHTKEGSVQVTLSRSFIDQVEIKHVEPEPESVTSGDARFIYTFSVISNEPAHLTLRFEPNSSGRLACEVGIVGGPRLGFQQFIYP